MNSNAAPNVPCHVRSSTQVVYTQGYDGWGDARLFIGTPSGRSVNREKV